MSADPSFGLTAREIGRIQEVLAGFPSVRRAIVYGSRAKGTHRPGSDIDLTLDGQLGPDELNRIETALDDLLLPYPLDLSALSLIDKPELLEHIRRVGKPIYQRPTN